MYAIHFDFVYRKVTQLGWSCDSEVLALLVDDVIQLWNSSNYHWSFKKEIFFSDSSKVLGFEWDPENPHCIRAFSQGNSIALQ